MPLERAARPPLGVMLVSDAIPEVDERGEPVRDDTLLILLNAGEHPLASRCRQCRRRRLGGGVRHRRRQAGSQSGSAPSAFTLGGASLTVLRLVQ